MAAGNTITVGISTAQQAYVDEMLEGIRNGASTAMRQAINDTLRHARTAITAFTREVLNLKATDIRERIAVKQLASGEELSGTLAIDYRAVPLIDFAAKFRRKSGVTVTTVKGDAAQVFRRQFVASMASGHRGTFQRVKGAAKVVPTRGRYAGRVIKRGPNKGQPLRRQPFKETYGPAVVTAFEKSPGLEDRALADADEFLAKRLLSKVDYILAKNGS